MPLPQSCLLKLKHPTNIYSPLNRKPMRLIKSEFVVGYYVYHSKLPSWLADFANNHNGYEYYVNVLPYNDLIKGYSRNLERLKYPSRIMSHVRFDNIEVVMEEWNNPLPDTKNPLKKYKLRTENGTTTFTFIDETPILPVGAEVPMSVNVSSRAVTAV